MVNEIDTRIKLSTVWIAHFLIWTFGDMLRLLELGPYEGADVGPILTVAGIIGIVQALMVTGNVVLDNKSMIRRLNLIFGVVFLVIDVGYIIDIVINNLRFWEYELVVIYILFDIMIILIAKSWQVSQVQNLKAS